MNSLGIARLKSLLPGQNKSSSESSAQPDTEELSLRKLRGSFLMLLGYALSPLCWWNDLIFNLPIAYGFGYLCSLISPQGLIPSAIVGYWLSNVVGILLMQAGFLDVMQRKTEERNIRKELFTGVVSSTLYTGVIVLLLHFKVLEMPLLFHP
jgi:hypothetical protein